MRRAAFLIGLSLAAGAAAAADVDPDRRALFIEIIEKNDCRMNNFNPAPGILDAIEANGFTRDEVRAIGTELMETGVGAREGDFFVLQTETCK